MPHQRRPTFGRYDRTWHDGKTPDGFTINGWRQVHKGGYVRMCGTRHYHERLAEWVGMWVFVEIDDGWAVNANCWPDEPWKDPRTMLALSNETDWFAVEADRSVRAALVRRSKRDKPANAELSGAPAREQR